MSRKEFRDLSTPAEAREAVESLDLTPDPETVPLAEARGRVLAERVDADLDVPGFDRASMDGYAVRARDTFGHDETDPATLDRVGAVHAGEEPSVTVEPGTCAEISTGAVLPDGADAVVIVERTTETADGDRIEVRTSVAPGDSVMFAGADIAAGARALGPGTELTPREIGLLSALGRDAVEVRGTPVVGIVSTGDELVRPGEELHGERGQIYDVNSYTVAAGVEEAGGDPRLYPHAGDDYEAMGDLLVEASEECDLVLSSGSTSASAVDVVYRVIEERGELLLHGVSIKPGKPMLVGRVAESAYVGLPGYPVSALTIFRTFVAPAIRRAAGRPEPRTATVEGRMAVRERSDEGRTRLVPVGLVEGGPSEAVGDDDGATGGADADGAAGNTLVYPVDKGSGATTSLVEADGVVTVDADTEYLAAGERVAVDLFSPDVRPPTLFGVGEDDPAFSRLLDGLDRPRYLAVGSREGLRRLREGVPDVAVTAGPDERESSARSGDGTAARVDAVDLGGWTREWGLVVPAGNPREVTGLADLIDRDLRFVNRDANSGLRASLGEAVATLADERGVDRREVVGAMDGFDRSVRAHESPARRVLAGDADAGLGLRVTAERLGAGFVPLGEEAVRVRANPDRTEKAGVAALRRAVEGADGVLDGLAGYEPLE
ncbi:molybdopterin biosynthesis protein [Candidatus Halobonum tyrrellensis]|uniref:Molybdopterin biosynthesis protein MoeA/LysR substrate binding-domain-containing protein n=1 Tax=Candidatus Halobonum tyrrellensis G22 TaxID=1324957 RepID=V4IYR7_9EURY|nr:molybdopterin biosynthesis protein [Candidatus Halobonum tyrrellensis]ESP88272.1 molybdopterin biosynthesis protein MoeA/LysR substrate binding-domain-containing protein [Candidatus Halobonum tyrrellensis G22]